MSLFIFFYSPIFSFFLPPPPPLVTQSCVKCIYRKISSGYSDYFWDSVVKSKNQFDSATIQFILQWFFGILYLEDGDAALNDGVEGESQQNLNSHNN